MKIVMTARILRFNIGFKRNCTVSAFNRHELGFLTWECNVQND